jgi:beta-phosphoglucomutase
MLRAILFDFNGILVDDEPIHFALFARVLAEEGVTLERQAYFERYLHLDDRDCFGAVLEAAGQAPAPAQLMRLIARKASYYRDWIRQQGYPFFPGALELVREVAASGLSLGVVSGALGEEVEGALEQAGMRERFKVLVTAEDVSAGKPDPQGYRKAIEALNARPPLPDRLFHPHEVLAIEDSPGGLAAAASAGLCTLGVAHTYPGAQLEAADQILEKLEGVRLADLTRLFA